MTTPLEQAVAYIKAGEIEKGKQLLADVIRQNPRDENAWLWMTKCVTSAEQKKYCFDKVLSINPQNQHAINGLKRLNNPTPSQSQSNLQSVQQSVPQQKSKKNTSSTIMWWRVGLLGIILCACCMSLLAFPALLNTNNSSQQNTLIPTYRARPNYRQMLEASAFTYYGNDKDGDPMYVSLCGCLATVKQDYVGFGAFYDPNNTCAIEDMGAIISIMYPSSVFDFIYSNMNSAIVQDQIVDGVVAGHSISMDFDQSDDKLVIVIRD